MLLHEIEEFNFNDSITLQDRDQAIIYYIAGYIAQSLIKTVKCLACHEFV